MYDIYDEDQRTKGIHIYFGGMFVFIGIFLAVMCLSPKKCGHHPHGSDAKTQCLMEKG